MEDKAVALAKKRRLEEEQVPTAPTGESDDLIDLQIHEDPSLGQHLSKVRAAILM